MPDPAPDVGTPRLSGIGQEHEQVFEALEGALGSVDFPATRGEIAERIGGVNVAADRDLPLVKYLQGLPEARYRSAQDVLDALNERWADLRGLRGAGWGFSEEPR